MDYNGFRQIWMDSDGFREIQMDHDGFREIQMDYTLDLNSFIQILIDSYRLQWIQPDFN